jgi:hypothetical protein
MNRNPARDDFALKLLPNNCFFALVKVVILFLFGNQGWQWRLPPLIYLAIDLAVEIVVR